MSGSPIRFDKKHANKGSVSAALRFGKTKLPIRLWRYERNPRWEAAALEYIQDGDTIILDAGTTTLAFAQVLKEQIKNVFVITCSVPVALELSSAGYDILRLRRKSCS